MRELPILTNCGVSSFSNSALFKLRERRFSVRIRVIFSCSEREMTQLHILTRLDAEQHLRYEPSERLCQALPELRGKLRQLRFESGSNAIVHRGTPHVVVWISRKNPSTTDFVPSHFPIPASY